MSDSRVPRKSRARKSFTTGPPLEAIPTEYAGVQFRSRFEANAAQLFDVLEWPWLYESRSFLLESGHYRPDFYLPNHKTWVECRGYDGNWEQVLEFPAFLQRECEVRSGESEYGYGEFFVLLSSGPAIIWSALARAYQPQNSPHVTQLHKCPACNAMAFQPCWCEEWYMMPCWNCKLKPAMEESELAIFFIESVAGQIVETERERVIWGRSAFALGQLSLGKVPFCRGQDASVKCVEKIRRFKRLAPSFFAVKMIA